MLTSYMSSYSNIPFNIRYPLPDMKIKYPIRSQYLIFKTMCMIMEDCLSTTTCATNLNVAGVRDLGITVDQSKTTQIKIIPRYRLHIA